MKKNSQDPAEASLARRCIYAVIVIFFYKLHGAATGDNGYSVYADGVIEQWGEYVGSQSVYTLLFPVKYNKKPLALGMNEINNGDTTAYDRYPFNVTNESMKIYPKSSSAYYKWYTKGY